MAGGDRRSKYAAAPSTGRGERRVPSLRTPADIQYMYEIGVRCMPPLVDLLDTPASRMLQPRTHKRFMRFIRAKFHVFSNVNRLCSVVIFAMWAAPAEVGRVVTPIATLGCFPVVIITIMLMSTELLELVVQQHEFWFFTITNASNWIIASVLFNDARVLGCIACFVISQLVILMDANFRTVITATRSCVLWIPAILVIISVCATRTVDIDPRRFRKIIPANKIDFTLANSFLNNNMTLMIFIVRKTFCRRHILKPAFLENRIIPCSVLRCDLVLQRMRANDDAGRSRYEAFQSIRESTGATDHDQYELNVSDASVVKPQLSTASRRGSVSSRDLRVFAPVSSTRSQSRRASSQRHLSINHSIKERSGASYATTLALHIPKPTIPLVSTTPGIVRALPAPPLHPSKGSGYITPRSQSGRQLLRVITPTLTFLDMRNTIFPGWTPCKKLPFLLSVAHYLSGGLGLLLGGFTMYLPPTHPDADPSHRATLSPRPIYAVVPALSLLFTTIFFTPFLASCQRNIVQALRRNFDFMFSSFQFTIGCVCLADMLGWDYRCLALVSWIQWFHWILLWDALLPTSRERFRFKKIYGTPVLIAIMLGLVWIVYSLFFSTENPLSDRTIVSIDWGSFRVSIRTSTFLVGRLNTILTWSLRLVWRTLRSEEDELMLIRGSLEYHTPLEIFPVLPQHGAPQKDKQPAVVPLASERSTQGN